MPGRTTRGKLQKRFAAFLFAQEEQQEDDNQKYGHIA